MKNIIYTISLVTLASILVVNCVDDEFRNTLVPETNGNTTQSQNDTYVYIPALVDATDQRIQQFSVPVGFKVQKFAEDIADEVGKYNPFPRMQDMTYAEYRNMTENPAPMRSANTAPMAMVFYEGNQSPAKNHGDSFVAYRGSWSRSTTEGYTVGRIRYEGGQPSGFYDILTRFLVDRDRAHFGSPVGLTVTSDGALLVSDDGIIYFMKHQ